MKTRLLFTGDYVVSTNRTVTFSDELKRIINQFDIKCTNLEGPIYNDNFIKQKKVGPNIYNTVDSYKYLVNSGFNFLCLANNHIFDYGKKGIENTIDTLKKDNVDYLGAGICNDQIDKPVIKSVNDTKIGFINVAENGFGAAVESDYGYNYMLKETLPYQISDLKKKCDLVFVICHAGAENFELPLPEIRDLYSSFIKSGADAVIGHHPHVPQGIEKVDDKYIVYSLGNFAFDINSNLKSYKSYMIGFEIDENNQLSYKRYSIKFDNGTLGIDDKNYEYLDEILLPNNNQEYINKIDDFCIKSYKYYKKCYRKAAVSDYSSIKEGLKTIVKKIVFFRNFEDIWLYHNITIETHYWICKRAVTILLKKNNIL